MNENPPVEESKDCDTASGTPQRTCDPAKLVRRYILLQREIAKLEAEKDNLRDTLVKELDGKVPSRWHLTVDGKHLVILHGHKTTVHYNEALLRDRLGEKYEDILEIDGTKIRKNRELVRPLLASVMDRIGTPAAARVEAAIRSGSLAIESFKGAFHKTVTPYISVRTENVASQANPVNVPY